MKSVVIIPARLKSSRLPNKVLMDICGKPLIQWVYDRVIQSRYANKIFIATDSEEIAQVVNGFGGEAILTSSTHNSGTDRIAEAVKNVDCDIVINVQGDEPLIDSNLIDRLIELFHNSDDVYFASAMHQIDSLEDLNNPNIVKVIRDIMGNAIYFSRLPIPFSRDDEVDLSRYYQHIGIYGYKKSFLQKYASLPQTYLEKIEKLEQLRAVENGFKIRMVETDYRSVGVDTVEDLEKVRGIICGEKR